MNEISIVLPHKISILRDVKNQGIRWDKEEYSIYYRNIIYPYSEEYDIQIECRYGKNLGHCWRLDNFENVEKKFSLTVKIYTACGVLAASKKCMIEILGKKEHKNIKLLCIGDSMTMSETYIEQAANKARNVDTVGLRSVRSGVRHEGRGGWTCEAYFERYDDNGWGVSPFLFPKGCTGKDYFGSRTFWDKVSDPGHKTDYSYTGIQPQYIKDGMVCFDRGRLYRYSEGAYTEECADPEFGFSFKKYVERYLDCVPDAVSILFGANEFQLCGYEELERELERYIFMLKSMVASIREYSRDIAVIICMPVCSGGQYAWGSRMGCSGSAKQYDFCIKAAGASILRNFDCRRDENIFICPMLAVCDPLSGFPRDMAKTNIYSENMFSVNADWVHPSDAGYKQMGDALAAVITDIRMNQQGDETASTKPW